MKKYVHKLLTDCLNLSRIGTLSPQILNDKCITISGSHGWDCLAFLEPIVLN